MVEGTDDVGDVVVVAKAQHDEMQQFWRQLLQLQ